MRIVFALLLLAAAPLAADSVLVGRVRRDKLPDNLEKLAVALETDIAVVLRGLGHETVMEGPILQKQGAADLGACSTDACLQRILTLSGQKTAVIPVLERVRNSENLNVIVFRMQGDKLLRESLLILFVNIERTKRREALETVLVQSFPRRAPQDRNAQALVPPKPEKREEVSQVKRDEKSPEKREEKPAPEQPMRGKGIHVVTDPGGAEVYVDGVLVGKSPLEISASESMRTLRIKMPGYAEVTMPVRTAGRLEIIVSLVPMPEHVPEAAHQPETRPAGGYPYWGAFARSLLLPGLGQLSKGEKGKALLFGAGFSGALGLSLFTRAESQQRFERVRDTYRQSDALLYFGASGVVSQVGLLQYFLHGREGYMNTVLASCSTKACNGYVTARRNARLSMYTLGGLYLWNAFDALLSGPAASAATSRSFQWGAAPMAVSEHDRGFILAARVRF